jgi:hypothetical protein
VIELAETTGLALGWWLLIGYVAGAAVVAFVAGLLDWDEPSVGMLAALWPLAAFAVCIFAPFFAIWFLGNMLRRDKRP